jgi:hypothetical protein
MQKVCGEAHAGAAAEENVARRPSGAKPSRWQRTPANRKRRAAIQPGDSSMVKARWTKLVEAVRCKWTLGLAWQAVTGAINRG